MNKRIKELAREAGYGSRWATTEQFEQFVEKFAELIVGECIRVIDNSTPVYSSEDLQEDYCQGDLNGHQSALLEIKQHFGVKDYTTLNDSILLTSNPSLCPGMLDK